MFNFESLLLIFIKAIFATFDNKQQINKKAFGVLQYKLKKHSVSEISPTYVLHSM